MNDLEKQKKVKNEIILWTKIYGIYGLLLIITLVSFTVQDNTLDKKTNISLYVILITLLFIFIGAFYKNIIMLGNKAVLRKKAIKKFDERYNALRQRSNTLTLIIILLILLLLIVVSILTNDIMLFAISFLFLIFIIIIRVLIGFIYNKIG